MASQYFKHLEYDLGYGPIRWKWPFEDQKLQSIFQFVEEIDEWIDLCKTFNVAIQAGGSVGVWPLRLSKLFKEVYTFEADPIVIECLIDNCLRGEARECIRIYHAALSNEAGKRVTVKRDEGHKHNFGAGFIVPGDDCSTMRIDDLDLAECNLICLDIEGAELDALKGAEETIEQYKPLIVLEDKPMPQLSQFRRSVGDPGKWLARFGYRMIKKVHWDYVYSC